MDEDTISTNSSEYGNYETNDEQLVDQENHEEITYIFEDRSQPQTVVDASGNQINVQPGANLSGRDFTNSNLINTFFGGVNLTGATFSSSTRFYWTDFLHYYNDNDNDNDNDNEIPANLKNVSWPEWWDIVIDDNVILTPDQMDQLNIRNPFEGVGDNNALLNFKKNYATVPRQTREEQEESMRNVITNLPSLANEVAKELKDKPDIGYGKCPICLQGFQLNDIVVDVHPYDNKPYDRHRFHKNCILHVCKDREPKCPICKKPIDCENNVEVIMTRLQGGKRKTTKKLRKYIRKVKKTNKRRKSRKVRKTKRRYRK